MLKLNNCVEYDAKIPSLLPTLIVLNIILTLSLKEQTY